jgi:Holliday junction resolvase RusA-like endonuclease
VPDTIRIELSGPPRGKGRGRAVSIPGRGARVYSDPVTVKYESQLRYAATQAMAGRVPFEGPVRMFMELRFPVPSSWSNKARQRALSGGVLPTVKPDLDNSMKLSDALNEICFRDDKQIVEALIVKRYSERPGMTIEVCEIELADHALMGAALALGADLPLLAAVS